jgi:hypothetical protein
MANIIQELQRINVFEKNLKRVRLTQNTNFNVNMDGKISFNIDGKSYGAKANRPLIHQLGSRIWPVKKDEYKSVYDKWENEYSSNKSNLANSIVNKLKESSSILLLDDSSNTLYGIISDHFSQIDPIEFRNRFLDEYRGTGMPLKTAAKFETTAFGELIEKYSFNESLLRKCNEPIEYNLQIIYGLNNGYSSFRVRLGRTVLICTNGLTAFDKLSSARLKHTSDADVSKFVHEIKADTLKYSHRFQETIEKSKNRNIRPSQLDELFHRLHVATVVKNRIKERFEIEKAYYGDNEWALSQAFTHLSTHFYGVGNNKHHEKILIEIGSDILDNSVEHVLDSEAKQIKFGELTTYGNLLP